MTPTDEAAFIALWTEGLTCPAIAQRLDIPPGTARSRAYTLQQQGKIAARPKGGRRVPARQEGTPAPAPAPPPVDAALPTREAPAITMVAVPELRELIHRFSGLEARVAALEDGTRGAPRDPPAPASSPAGTRTPGTIKQWTVRLSQPLIDAVKAHAATIGKEPSHVVEELLWKALTDQSPSMS
jgi:hypothetical protein